MKIPDDSYIDVADADKFHDNRSNKVWFSAYKAQRQAALRLATEYIDDMFEFRGGLQSFDQRREWPRVNVFDNQGRQYVGIPDRLQEAVAMLALEAIEGEIFEEVSRNDVLDAVQIDTIRINFNDHAPRTRSFPYIRNRLKPITTSHNKLMRT